MATTLCTQFGWNKYQFAHDTEWAHHGNYKNPNSPIYAKFLSWKVAQDALKSIIKASQKYSKKVQDQMNSLLLKRKEFKEDEVRKTWKSYVKFLGVLMVKKSQQMQNTKFLTVILEMPFCYCDMQMYSSPGLDVGEFGDAQCFLRIYIRSVYLNACRFLRFVP